MIDCSVASHRGLNQGSNLCPDWEWNPQSFGVWEMFQPIETPGQGSYTTMVLKRFSPQKT